jgi:hypothetical protein
MDMNEQNNRVEAHREVYKNLAMVKATGSQLSERAQQH